MNEGKQKENSEKFASSEREEYIKKDFLDSIGNLEENHVLNAYNEAAKGQWFRFKDPVEQDQYVRFLELRTSLRTVFTYNTVFTIMAGLHLAQNISAGLDIYDHEFAIRGVRFLSVVISWMYYLREYDFKRGDTTHLFETSYRSLLPNLALIMFSLTGGLMLLLRSCSGPCTEDMAKSQCNPWAANHHLPADTLIMNMVQVLFLPVVFKSHHVIYTAVSYVLSLGFMLASLYFANAKNDIVCVVSIMTILASVLYDYESSTFSFYISQYNVKSLYREALNAFEKRKTSELENENLCTLVGNVSHDLKTPLQSFMGELANLEAMLAQLFQWCDSENPVVTETRGEITEILQSLDTIYSFMMLAINRGIDFRKAMAGLALQPSRGTFHVVDAVKWAVKRVGVGPTGVLTTVVPPSHPTNVYTKEGMCPLVISDKHWFEENILSLVSNAQKFTLTGQIEVKYELFKLVRNPESEPENDQSLAVVLYGSDFEKHFVPLGSENYSNSMLDIPVESSTTKSKEKVFLVVQVHDSGVGIVDDVMSTLFKPFCQAQRRAGGTGLGLFSISKRMEALGGHCGVQHSPYHEQGSCFWLAYPYVPDWDSVEREDAPQQSLRWVPFPIVMPTVENLSATPDRISTTTDSLPSTPSINISTRLPEMIESMLSSLDDDALARFAHTPRDRFWRRVLLVEDSLIIIKSIGRLLKREGLQVEIAQNGDAGLALLEKNEYFVVLTDIHMPLLGGFEMTQRFREFEKSNRSASQHRQLIIGMSSNSDSETQDSCNASGMDGFIVKPVSKASLCDLVSKFYFSDVPLPSIDELPVSTVEGAGEPSPGDRITTTPHNPHSAEMGGSGAVSPLAVSPCRSRTIPGTFQTALSSLDEDSMSRLPFPPTDPFWRRVLLVEDSPMILKTITRLLRNEGFEVEIAQNGKSGLEKLRKEQYVAVLSDIQMPVMDGNEMTKRFRDHEQRMRPACANGSISDQRFQLIIGMSANSDAETESESLTSGMDCFIAKPVSKVALQTSMFEYHFRKTTVGSV